MNKFLTSVLLCCFMIGPAVAAKDAVNFSNEYECKPDASDTRPLGCENEGSKWVWPHGQWMAGDYISCGRNTAAAGVLKKVGEQKKKGDVYWIAWDLNAYGGRFCPTQLGAGRSGAGSAYTTYYSVTGLDCIWLCKNGFGGDECKAKVSALDGSERPIAQTIESISSDGTNQENLIAMLISNKNPGCGGKEYKPFAAKNGQEHDVVLAITEYTPDGYGAYVQPLVVRAAARRVADYWGDYNDGWPMGYVANNTDKTLVCLKGYKHNASGNGCVKYSQEQVEREAAQAEAKTAADNACSGWVISTTDEFINTYDIKRVGNCNQYRCKDSSMGFKSSLDKTCVSCGADDQHGVNPDTGVCVSCSVKQTFSADEQYRDSGYCRDKVVFIPAAMQYGLNSTKDESLEKQCWHILYKKGVEEYKNCIFGQAGETK